MKKITNNYWKKRAIIDKRKAIRVEETGIATLKRDLRQSLKDINKKIEDFYAKYGDNPVEKLSYAEFRKYKANLIKQAKLNPQDKTLQRLAKQDIPKYRIDRLRALQTDIQYQLTEITKTQEAKIYKTLKDVAKVSQASAILRLSGAGMSFNTFSTKKLEKIISSNWSGKVWSSRIWKDREDLGKKVESVLAKGLPQGASMQEMARELKDLTHQSFNNAFRLVRTEGAHVDGEILLESFKQAKAELGYTKYIFDATIDNRTSDDCERLDGKVIPIDEAVIGENFPPVHPNCRSTAMLDESSIDESVIED